LHRFNRTKYYTALIEQNLALGICKLVLIKSAVQKIAVGGAKNGGRGLEKKTYPFCGWITNVNCKEIVIAKHPIT
jgi:hypothetical protein